MREEFYYTKEFIAFTVFVVLLTGARFGLVAYDHVYLAHNRFTLDFVLGLFACVGLLVETFLLFSFLVIGRTAVTIMSGRIIYRNRYFFGERELGFEKIISATVKSPGIELRSANSNRRARIEIKYRKPDNRAGKFSIFLFGIDKPDRLIEVLKERIKFQ